MNTSSTLSVFFSLLKELDSQPKQVRSFDDLNSDYLGFFVSLTGALAAIPCFFYSTYLHSSGGGDKNLFAQVINM